LSLRHRGYFFVMASSWSRICDCFFVITSLRLLLVSDRGGGGYGFP
jgi:hypothetical protein